VPVRPVEVDFEAAAFREIAVGSEVRESIGFVPYEPGAEYLVGSARWAFRVRIDRLRPDPTTVRERVMQLVASESEATGSPFIGPRKRRKLKELAEEEVLSNTFPTSRIVECALDGDVLYVGSTAKGQSGRVLTVLRKVGVAANPKAPWVEREEGDPESGLLDLGASAEPGQSVLGCRFLGALLGDPLLTFEPVDGRVVLQTHRAKVSLTGEVLPDVLRYTEEGAEILSAKLTTGEVSFRLDGPSWRVSGLKADSARQEHWIERLDERLNAIAAVYDLLETKYAEIDPASLPAPVIREGRERATG
jgi:hypothetical protein